MTDSRLAQALSWLKSMAYHDIEVKPLAGDASFRRYFRVFGSNQMQYVLMDAPPEKEDVSPFIHVCHWLEKAGLNVPTILQSNQAQGFLLLQDFGDMSWSAFLTHKKDSAPLFENAIQQLLLLQKSEPNIDIPLFDVSRMQQEADLYLDWYLPHIKSITPSHAQRHAFHQALLPTLTHINNIPKAPVHLDYHSRNLMVPPHGLPLGVIDFQDAVLGPITYDLASLLYDCYQNYPEPKRRQWSQTFFAQLPVPQQAYFESFEAWHHALRLTALQRHIKAIGIFARLAFRDGKQQFLQEIPLTRQHLDDELQALSLSIPLLNDKTSSL